MGNAAASDQPQGDAPALHADRGLGSAPLASDALPGDGVSRKSGPPAGKKRPPTRSPTIGGIRRIMRRAHTPAGMVVHFEGKLRAFLGIEGSAEDDDDDDDWQLIDKEEGTFSPFGRDVVFDEGDMVVLGKALLRVQESPRRRSPQLAAGIKSGLVAEWPIKDSFARLVVHTMCRYYGLVSFSDTLEGGRAVVHICHPRFFDDAEEVCVPKETFHDFLYTTQH
ncbi:hypothetical protein H4R18_000609 [Coemansia javaensis]|uniref:R3H-associated N-terminal domain-containing protein n=1 Tax=Coemansia javaensis TaxID=2761396 RepID=A0A9W8HKM2_9FUNG|nr:hypothetical protein H4R18_000609 [Coemansia javaensis]